MFRHLGYARRRRRVGANKAATTEKRAEGTDPCHATATPQRERYAGRMDERAWTPLIGVLDILRYLKARAHWGAIIWAIALALVLDGSLATSSKRAALMYGMTGGLGAGIAMTWRLSERHQWVGLIPYLVATLGVWILLAAMTLLAHAIWGFEPPSALQEALVMSAVGVLLRGVGHTAWLAPYRRSG